MRIITFSCVNFFSYFLTLVAKSCLFAKVANNPEFYHPPLTKAKQKAVGAGITQGAHKVS